MDFRRYFSVSHAEYPDSVRRRSYVYNEHKTEKRTDYACVRAYIFCVSDELISDWYRSCMRDYVPRHFRRRKMGVFAPDVYDAQHSENTENSRDKQRRQREV